MKKIDRLILSAAAGAAVLLYVTRPRGRSAAVPTTAANRLAQIRADAFRSTLGRELRSSPEFWV